MHTIFCICFFVNLFTQFTVMKKLFLPLLFAGICYVAGAQKFSRVNFNESGDVETLGVELDEGVLVNISKEGTIIKFGVDIYRGVRENNQNILQDYVGRTEYYTENDNEAFRGKVKMIGRAIITYYSSTDNEAMVGKIKSIGNLKFDYFLLNENDAYKGKLKSIGSNNFTYYSSYDNEALRGKYKSIGNSTITYYSSVEDPGFKGKVKSIGSYQYTYHPMQYFQAGLRGRLKSGNIIQQDGSIKYMLKY